MASKHIHEIIARLTGFGKADKGVKKLSASMKKFAGSLLGAAAAYKTFSTGLESIQLAGKLEGVETAFNNMRKEAGFSINTFSKLDKALNGTADRMTIMEQANNAMLLGIAESDDQMAEMFDVAQRLAQALGQDARFGIESLVTGLGRQSKLMLDNLGIMVDVASANEKYAEALGKSSSKLTDQERKQAFINEAMRQGKTLVEGIGEETLTSSQKLEKFSTAVTNLKTAVGEALIESGALDQLERFTDWLNKTADSGEKSRVEVLNEQLEELKQKRETLLLQLRVINKARQEGDFIFDPEGKTKTYNTELKAVGMQIASTKLEIETLNSVQGEAQILRGVEIDQTEKLTAINKDFTNSVLGEADAQEYYQSLVADSAIVSINALKDVGRAFNVDSKILEGITIAQAVADTYAGANKSLAAGVPPFNYIAAAGVVASGLANVASIRQAYDKKQGQTGFEGMIDEPTQFTVGEGGAAEYVSVTPMEGVNNAGGGQGININITGNVMSESWVEEELAEKISEAVRRGVNFGMS